MFKFNVNDEVVIKEPFYTEIFDPVTYQVSRGTIVGCNFSRTAKGDKISYTVKVGCSSDEYDESQLELLTDKMKDAVNKSALFYCPKCGELFEVNRDKTYNVKTIDHNRCVYADGEYGDDDKFADIEYTNICQKCPKCGKEVRLFFLKEELKETRHSRWRKR